MWSGLIRNTKGFHGGIFISYFWCMVYIAVVSGLTPFSSWAGTDLSDDNDTAFMPNKALRYKIILVIKPTRCTNFSNFFWCRIHLWFRYVGGFVRKVDDVTAYLAAQPSRLRAHHRNITTKQYTHIQLQQAQSTSVLLLLQMYSTSSTVQS